MDAHENALPMEWKVFANTGQRDECILARRWRGFKRRKTHTPEALTLPDKIQRRSLQAPVPSQLKVGFVAMQAKKVILRQQEKQCEAHRECLPQHLPANWQERLVSEPWRPNPVRVSTYLPTGRSGPCHSLADPTQ